MRVRTKADYDRVQATRVSARPRKRAGALRRLDREDRLARADRNERRSRAAAIWARKHIKRERYLQRPKLALTKRQRAEAAFAAALVESVGASEVRSSRENLRKKGSRKQP